MLIKLEDIRVIIMYGVEKTRKGAKKSRFTKSWSVDCVISELS